MQLHPVRITDKLIAPNNLFLAPLAGYTNAVFREMCQKLGAGLTFTEMVSAKGLCYNSAATKELLFIIPTYVGGNVCQLFGSEPEYLQRAACSEELAPFDMIDINMGCPMPKIYNNGEGSALLADLNRASTLIQAVKKSGKAVSVKFRTGIDANHIVTTEFAKMCQDSGADLITIHGRTRDKIYAGDVNFAEIEKAKHAVSIPVIANGGVFDEESAQELMDKTGADGIAIARGAMYRPWIFAELTGKTDYNKNELVLKQLKDTQTFMGDRFAVVFIRKMITFYLKGQENASKLKVKIFDCQTVEEIEEILHSVVL